MIFIVAIRKRRHLHARLARHLLVCAEVTNHNQDYVTPEVQKNVPSSVFTYMEATKTVFLLQREAKVILPAQVKAVIQRIEYVLNNLLFTRAPMPHHLVHL